VESAQRKTRSVCVCVYDYVIVYWRDVLTLDRITLSPLQIIVLAVVDGLRRERALRRHYSCFVVGVFEGVLPSIVIVPLIGSIDGTALDVFLVNVLGPKRWALVNSVEIVSGSRHLCCHLQRGVVIIDNCLADARLCVIQNVQPDQIAMNRVVYFDSQ